MVHNKFSVILILIASAIAPVVAPPPPVTPVTGQRSPVHLDIQHSPPTSPSHSPPTQAQASTSHHTGPVPPVTSVTPQVGGHSDRSHVVQEPSHNPSPGKSLFGLDDPTRKHVLLPQPVSPTITQDLKGKARAQDPSKDVFQGSPNNPMAMGHTGKDPQDYPPMGRPMKPLPKPKPATQIPAPNPVVQGSPNDPLMMGHSSSHNTAHDPSHEFVQGSSNPPKKRKLLDDFESTYHEHLVTITPAQNAKDASIESRYYVKFQLIVLFYIDGRDSQKGFGPDAERKRCKY